MKGTFSNPILAGQLHPYFSEAFQTKTRSDTCRHHAPCFSPSHLVDDPAFFRLFWWHRVHVPPPSTFCVSTACPSHWQLYIYFHCNCRERVDCFVHVTLQQTAILFGSALPKILRKFDQTWTHPTSTIHTQHLYSVQSHFLKHQPPASPGPVP